MTPADPMNGSPIDPRALRNAFGAYPTGVTVVTTMADAGIPVGFTANSFSSVSLDPPMLLVCPAKTLASFAVFEGCARFAVNVLAEGQEEVANVFAGFKGDRFAQVAWRPDAAGMPTIDGTAASFSCRTASVVPAGDHVILLGTVEAFSHGGARGLGYAAGRYFSLGLERAAAEAPQKGRLSYAGAIVLAGDAVLLMPDGDGWAPPQIRLDPGVSPRTALADRFAELGIDVALGNTYSIYDGRQGEHFTFFLARAAEGAACGTGRFVPLDELSDTAVASPAERAMLDRFVRETRAQAYGFYVGDSVTGYVHAMPDDR